jgi:phosphatidate cytidylyltransferase
VNRSLRMVVTRRQAGGVAEDNNRAGGSGADGLGAGDCGDGGGGGAGREDFRTSHDGAGSFGVSTRSRTPKRAVHRPGGPSSTANLNPAESEISERSTVTSTSTVATATETNRNQNNKDDDKNVVSAAAGVASAEDSHEQMVAGKAKRPHSDLFLRTVSALVMFVSFVLVILGGHMWVSIAVVAMEIGMFREILGLGYAVAAGGRIPLWRTTGWYFFASCLFLFYGKSVLAHFEDQGRHFMTYPAMQYALRHHTFISFVLYCTGFVGFVLSLRQGQYQYQFSYFGRALAALVLVVVQSHFMILNVREGLVWFVLPSSLVIINDSFAYVCGRLFGRHSLTRLSPKKTWEGYIGGGIFTIVTAFFLSRWLAHFPSLICPKYEWTNCIYYCPRMSCDPLPYVFIPKIATFSPLPGILPQFSFSYLPVQLHALALALFASAIAPFGGFFASGAKRAFNIKDFANLFPGHGGVTDRVDCQLLMAVFSYVYIINFVDPNFSGSPDVGKVMSFVSDLSTNEQIELLVAIQSRLLQKGIAFRQLDVVSDAVLGTR